MARLPGGGWFVVAYDGAKILQSAKPVRLAAGGMLFCDEKWAKGFLGQDGNRLAAGRSLLQGLASTPRRRGVPFTCVCRRGLRSMSGHPAYAWGNPPTLRRSSFPQRALRPAGGPIPKRTWGCAPRPPNASEPPARKAKGRLPGAGLDDAYKVPQAHFYVEIVDRVPLPRCGEGGRGCGAERRQWRMQRGGAPVAVEKIEQASSAKIFSGTARRQGLRFAEE